MFVLIVTRYVTAYALLARSARLECSGTSRSVCSYYPSKRVKYQETTKVIISRELLAHAFN